MLKAAIFPTEGADSGSTSSTETHIEGHKATFDHGDSRNPSRHPSTPRGQCHFSSGASTISVGSLETLPCWICPAGLEVSTDEGECQRGSDPSIPFPD
jgi:hypothetical protein